MTTDKGLLMADKQKIINIAVIAHVDAGKSTLVDALLAQSHVFRDNEQIVDCVRTPTLSKGSAASRYTQRIAP